MFKLRLQFFIIILLLSSLLTAGLYFYIKFSFKQDFWHYIEKKEIRFAQPLTDDLIEQYKQHHNWQWIPQWSDYVFQQLENEFRERSEKNGAPQEHPEPHHSDLDDNHHQPDQDLHPTKEHDFHEWHEGRRRPPMQTVRAIFLLDAQHKLVAGNNPHIDKAFLIELNDGNNIIGYLGIPFNPALRDLQDANFAQLQEQKLAIIIFVALIFASLAAIPLAHLLTVRIKQLVAHVENLSKGQYLEKTTIQGNDELNVLADHLNNLGEILAHTEQTRRQWVADISHELRTPLAVLQAELEAMEDGVRPLDKTSIERLSLHCKRLTHLVNDLYELSLTDIGGMTYRKAAINLATILQETTSTLQPQFVQAGIDLQIAIEHARVDFFGDPIRLQQLFTNLLKNSLQYTNTPGITRVTLNIEAKKIIITIEDSAPGVADEHVEKLFDRLYRADSSRNRTTGGAGLGLSICKNIVAAHDGQITINHSELGGLKLKVIFPC